MNKEAFFKARALTNPHIFNVPLKLDKHGVGWLFVATLMAQKQFMEETRTGESTRLAQEGDIYMHNIQGQLTQFATDFRPGH